MLAAVWERSGDVIYCSSTRECAYDAGVYVKVPLIINVLERALKDYASPTALDRNNRDTARHFLAVAGHLEF